MKKARPFCLIASAALLCSPGLAHAATFCGPAVITRSLIYTDGSVKIFAPWRNDFVQICNLKVNWKGVDPQLCWSWSARVDNAISKGQRIALYYADLQPGECATMLTYAGAPAPLYLEFTT
jgi:hypothetical protein